MRNTLTYTLAALVGTAVVTGAAESGASVGLINDWLRAEAPAAKSWDLGGAFRVRYEEKSDAGSFPNRDFLRGLDNSNDYLLFRTKAHVGWNPESWIGVYVEGRDAHDIGDERPVPETDVFDLHQGYVRLGDPKKFPVTLKIGRQEMIYGEERWVGLSDWSNTGRSFDAAKLRYENDFFWVEGFTSRVVIPYDEHFNVSNDYDWFSGVYASSRKAAPWQETDVYFLSRNVGAASPAAVAAGFGGPGRRDIYTIGTRWKSLPNQFGNWDYLLEAAGQFGGIGGGATRLDQQAYAVDVTGGYTFTNAFGTPRVAVGYDFGSGDSNPTDKKNGTIDLLLGTNHKFYGVMDIMGLRNLHAPRVGGSIKPVKDLTLTAEWLGFWMVETADLLYPESAAGRTGNGYGRNPGFSSYVGNELDFVAVYRAATWAQFQGGYGHFFPGDYIRKSAAKGGFGVENADWVYLQCTLSF